MFEFLKVALGAQSGSDGETTKASTSSNGNGIDIRVGRSARPMHISRSALKACPMMRLRLVQGSTIVNVDPVVFEIIIDHLNNTGLMGKFRGRNPLDRLIGGSDTLLKLAKAWHIADMLNLMSLQNKLVDTYRVFYLRLLDSRTRMPLDREPFTYLIGRAGLHTTIEDFIIDFYAGLARYGGEFQPEDLQALPEHVGLAIKHQRARLAVQGNLGDRIALNHSCFKISTLNEHKITTLQVVAPIAVPTTTSSTSSPTQRGWSISSLTSMLSPSLSKSPSPPPSSNRPTTGRGLGHRVRMSLPDIISVSGDSEVMVSRAMAPILESAFSQANRPTATRSHSMVTMLPSRAPFMDHVPVTPRRQREMDAESESSWPEEEPGLILFSPTLLQTYDPRQDQAAVKADN